MSPDELPSQPRKASWKRWFVVLAGVLAIVVAVLFLKAPSPDPVSVRFVGSTNYNGQRILSFTGSNGLSTIFNYRVWAIPASVKEAKRSPLMNAYPNPVFGTAFPTGTFSFTIEVPQKDTNWCIVWTGGVRLHYISASELKE